jgi:acyl-CoA thioester hydrolase
MEELKKILESKAKVRFHDCDPFNHLNNSRYIDYIVTARGDQLMEHYSLDIYALAQERGVGWVAAQTQIAYLAPARLMEEVIIQTQLLSFTEKALQVEALMWNSDKKVLKAVMWSKLVHYNLHTQRSHPHSEELQQLFHHVVNPLNASTDFDTRVKSLKANT